MKLQLDTTNKTVKVEENVKVSQLIKTLKALLPKDWENFTIETHTVINNWSYPIIIKEPYYEPYRYPWYSGTLCDSSGDITPENTQKYCLQSGVYNVET